MDVSVLTRVNSAEVDTQPDGVMPVRQPGQAPATSSLREDRQGEAYLPPGETTTKAATLEISAEAKNRAEESQVAAAGDRSSSEQLGVQRDDLGLTADPGRQENVRDS